MNENCTLNRFPINPDPNNPASFIHLRDNLNTLFEDVLTLKSKINNLDPTISTAINQIVGVLLGEKVDKETTITINNVTQPLTGNVAFTVSGGGSGSTSPFAPLSIPEGETFTIPENNQVLFATPIEVDGVLITDGTLIEI